MPTFDQLVDEATRQIHSHLLEGGGKCMRNAVFNSMDGAIRWYIAGEIKKNLYKAKRKSKSS